MGGVVSRGGSGGVEGAAIGGKWASWVGMWEVGMLGGKGTSMPPSEYKEQACECERAEMGPGYRIAVIRNRR